jgi:hypoxanthine phosphoribosyltransferase
LTEHDLGRTLFTSGEIQKRVRQIASEIGEDYRGRPLVMIGILKGAFIFLADLARHISIPVEFDFVALSSYGSGTRSSGVVRILKDLDSDINGKSVLIVEDLIDTGLTLNYLIGNLRARGAESVAICALLNKEVENQIEIPIVYEGFRIPDVFVVGYGMDCSEMYRNLPYIAVLEE